MKKDKTKRKKRKFTLLIFIGALYISFNILDNSKISISDKKIAKILLETNGFIKTTKTNKVKKIIEKIYNNPNILLPQQMDTKLKAQIQIVQKEEKQEQPPSIYIYNTHQTEEYAPSEFIEYNIKPTIMIANYILEDIFNRNNFKTLVEQDSIQNILNQNNWKYSNSYKASRILLEQRKSENNTLKYYIDVHRDSLTKDKTTIEINGKSYAKLLFLIGLENENYQENLNFTETINNLLNERYPNLSKGIYKKGGIGVNGIYNQDFSPFVILIEIGGYENTTTEVMNSAIAFAECFMEVIKSYENKTTN